MAQHAHKPHLSLSPRVRSLEVKAGKHRSVCSSTARDDSGVPIIRTSYRSSQCKDLPVHIMSMYVPSAHMARARECVYKTLRKKGYDVVILGINRDVRIPSTRYTIPLQQDTVVNILSNERDESGDSLKAPAPDYGTRYRPDPDTCVTISEMRYASLVCTVYMDATVHYMTKPDEEMTMYICNIDIHTPRVDVNTIHAPSSGCALLTPRKDLEVQSTETLRAKV
jgi:hypothetical protein